MNCRTRRDERGMIVVLIGVSMMMIMALAALVIDVSFLRNDRRADQKIADAAATAGAVALSQTNGEGGCQAVVDYLDAHIDGVAELSSLNCQRFHEFCDPSTASESVSGIIGDYRVEIVHPVPDWHPLMARPSAIGAPNAPVVTADGSRCQRIGVSIQLARAPSFGAALGDSGRTTQVHAVVKADNPFCCDLPINLLILERTDCNAIVIDGQPWLVVGAITAPNGALLPGILAVDSDGTGSNCGPTSNGTLHAQGTSATAQADGPPFCPAELVAGTGQGCGFIELYAQGVPGPASPLYCEGGVYRPACTSTAVVRPHPVRMAERRTREPVDHHFNCNNGYGQKPWYGDHPIGSCPGATSSTDYVDELLSFAGGGNTPTGWNVYGDGPGEPCTIDGQMSVVVPEGNTRVVCSVLSVKRTMTFSGGNVIFDGDVVVSAGGDLRIHACGQEGVNNCAPNSASELPSTWQRGQDFVESHYSSDAAWVAFRSGGGIQKDARGSLRIYDAAIFLPQNADIGTSPPKAMALSGGDGALQWYAPRQGPFDVLAMWSDSTNQHDLGGSAELAMEGVYFAPVARMAFRGNGGQNQVAAQLITETLTVSGGGTLKVVPDFFRSLRFPSDPLTTIIR